MYASVSSQDKSLASFTEGVHGSGCTSVALRQMLFQRPVHAVERADAFLVAPLVRAKDLFGDIGLERGHVEVMNCFGSFSSAAVNIFDLFFDVAITVHFGQLRGRTVG